MLSVESCSAILHRTSVPNETTTGFGGPVHVDSVSLAWYGLLFENRYLKAEGDVFQDLFVSIMERAHLHDFTRVQPWGNKGDMKCDGYLFSQRMVFACYGPKEFAPMARALAKIEGDHGGAVLNWKAHMSAWTFVHNDHRGLPPEILALLLRLRGVDADVSVAHWGASELAAKVKGLPLAELVALFGQVPTARQVRGLRQEDLHNVIPALVGALTVGSHAQDLRPVPPEKLEHNQLSESARLLLVSGMQVSDRVRQFFERWDPGVGDRIAGAFKQRYLALRDEGTRSPDEILWALYEYAGGGHLETVREQIAVLAFVAFLFETCEIFERPPAAAIVQ